MSPPRHWAFAVVRKKNDSLPGPAFQTSSTGSQARPVGVHCDEVPSWAVIDPLATSADFGQIASNFELLGLLIFDDVQVLNPAASTFTPLISVFTLLRMPVSESAWADFRANFC